KPQELRRYIGSDRKDFAHVVIDAAAEAYVESLNAYVVVRAENRVGGVSEARVAAAQNHVGLHVAERNVPAEIEAERPQALVLEAGHAKVRADRGEEQARPGLYAP